MKNFLKLTFFLVPFIIFAQGATSKTFKNTIELDQNVENVWNAITDFSTISLWDSNVVDVRCGDGLAKNKRCKVIVGSGEVFDVEIVDLVDNESYTIRYRLSSGNIYIKRSLEQKVALELIETVWYTGISKRTFEKYKGADYEDTLKQRLLEFKKYVETDVTGRR